MPQQNAASFEVGVRDRGVEGFVNHEKLLEPAGEPAAETDLDSVVESLVEITEPVKTLANTKGAHGQRYLPSVRRIEVVEPNAPLWWSITTTRGKKNRDLQ
jgi:hypothetical protein